MHPLPLHDINPQMHEPSDYDETNTDMHQLSITSLIRE